MAHILTDVEAFLEAHSMAATRFGDEAMGDRHLVRQLREGRRLWPETETKVRRFMVTYRQPLSAPSAPRTEQVAA